MLHVILGADMDLWGRKKNLFFSKPSSRRCHVAALVRSSHLLSCCKLGIESILLAPRRCPTTLPLECPNMTSTPTRLPGNGDQKLASARLDRDRAVCSGLSEASPAFSVRATCTVCSESQTRLAHVDDAALDFEQRVTHRQRALHTLWTSINAGYLRPLSRPFPLPPAPEARSSHSALGHAYCLHLRSKAQDARLAAKTAGPRAVPGGLLTAAQMTGRSIESLLHCARASNLRALHMYICTYNVCSVVAQRQMALCRAWRLTRSSTGQRQFISRTIPVASPCILAAARRLS